MNNAMTDFGLRTPFVNPTGRGVIASPSPRPRFDWRRVAGGACLLAGITAFATSAVGLRLSLYGHLAVDARVASAATIAGAIVGLLSFAGVRWLDDPRLSGERPDLAH